MIERTRVLHRREVSRAKRAIWVDICRIATRVTGSWKRMAWTALVVSAGLGAYFHVSNPTHVLVAVVKTTTTTETLGASGKVQGERVANVGLDAAGVVRGIYVKESDSVRAGQLMLSLDKSEMDARVRGASAAVATAEAEFDRANRGPLPSEVCRARAELSQAGAVGDARVAQAQARLDNLKAGARPQELRGAEVELQRRKRILTKSEIDLKRTKDLVEQGALPRSNLDQANADVDSARSDMEVQQEALSLLKAGASSDQVAEARAGLAEARASRDTSVRAAQESIRTLLSIPRLEDVRAARAKVTQARAELQQAFEARAKSDQRAPFSGIIADIPVEEGQSVSPGQTLIIIHEMARPIIAVETGEENLKVLSIGQTATISSDAFPGRSFSAVLYDLGSRIDPDRGTIEIKLRPTQRVSWLRPDMTVDVNIVTKRNVRRNLLPPTAVTTVNGHTCVYLVRNGKAVPVPVTTGGTGPMGIAVFSNLKDGDLVVQRASDVGPYTDIEAIGSD